MNIKKDSKIYYNLKVQNPNVKNNLSNDETSFEKGDSQEFTFNVDIVKTQKKFFPERGAHSHE